MFGTRVVRSLAAAMLVVTAGCSWMVEKDERQVGHVELDLTNGPLRSGVPGTGPDTVSITKSFEYPESVTIRLPGGHEFHDADSIRGVEVGLASRRPEFIDSVQVSFLPETGEEVEERFRRYARLLHLDTAWLDAWGARRRGQPIPPGAKDPQLLVGRFDPLGSELGPEIEARTSISFDDERPYVARVYFGWGHLRGLRESSTSGSVPSGTDPNTAATPPGSLPGSGD